MWNLIAHAFGVVCDEDCKDVARRDAGIYTLSLGLRDVQGQALCWQLIFGYFVINRMYAVQYIIGIMRLKPTFGIQVISHDFKQASLFSLIALFPQTPHYHIAFPRNLPLVRYEAKLSMQDSIL